MSGKLKWGIGGVFVFVMLSGLLAPASCNALQETYKEIDCSFQSNIGRTFDMYSEIYPWALLLLGFILGSLIGNLFDTLENKANILNQIKENQFKKKNFKWMWEH